MKTSLHAKEQLRLNTLDLGRLELNFLNSVKWDPNNGNTTTPGTLTGIPDPTSSLDVANKNYVDNLVSTGGKIGNPEDGVFTDGLFEDFVPNTLIGTAVDRINEVLKSLAPSPAPVLTIANATTTGVSGKLSFDDTHAIAGVAAYPAININTLVSVAGNVRGIINASTTVVGTIAQNVAPNYTNSRPYPNYSFGSADQGLLHLEVNGTVVKSITLSTFVSGASVDANGSGFTLSAATSVKFDNGNSLDLFKYRTGTFTIAPASMVPGYNSVRVRHEYVTGSFRDTNSSVWVVDNDVNATSYDTPVLNSLVSTGSSYISGVRYHTGGTAAFSVAIHNAYKNTFSNSASALSFNGVNCSCVSQALPSMTDYTNDISVSSKTATINAARVLNSSISVSASTLRTVQSTITSSIASIGNILIDATVDDATAILETFNGENYRMHSGIVLNDVSYGTGTAKASAYSWDSTQNLASGSTSHNSGLLVSGGELTYPNNTTHIGTVVSGNFAAASNGYASNADYTAVTGNRTYIRYFYDSLARSNFRLNVVATGTSFVSVATGVSGNNLTLEIVAPNTTINSSGTPVWKDANVAHSGIDTDIGCYAGAFGNSIPTNWGLTLGSKNTSNSGKVIAVKITASAAWTGKISTLSITWL